MYVCGIGMHGPRVRENMGDVLCLKGHYNVASHSATSLLT